MCGIVALLKITVTFEAIQVSKFTVIVSCTDTEGIIEMLLHSQVNQIRRNNFLGEKLRTVYF